jgi:cellulose synthase/poly-beta-1,6-N-acetylglucosamine synthase-like glycosyltransferase
VSIIISAYNEQSTIAEKMQNTLDLDYPKEKLQVIVASESTDKTNEIVNSYQQQQICLFAYDGREGKAATLYKTVPHAKGKIVVFSDTNAMYEKDAIKKLVRNFSDERIGCVSGRLKYSNPDNTSVGFGEGFYWRHETVIKKLESRLHSLLGANGSIFAIRRDLYLPMTRDRGDDFELPIRIAINGYGVILEPEAVSWEKASKTTRDELRRKVRIIAWNMKSCLMLLRECFQKRKVLLVFQLISHKLLRWLFPVFATGLLITNIFLSGVFFRILLVLQLVFYTAAGIGCILDVSRNTVPRLLLVPYYFCLMHYAAIAGVYRLMCGKQKSVWKKVRD